METFVGKISFQLNRRARKLTLPFGARVIDATLESDRVQLKYTLQGVSEHEEERYFRACWERDLPARKRTYTIIKKILIGESSLFYVIEIKPVRKQYFDWGVLIRTEIHSELIPKIGLNTMILPAICAINPLDCLRTEMGQHFLRLRGDFRAGAKTGLYIVYLITKRSDRYAELLNEALSLVERGIIFPVRSNERALELWVDVKLQGAVREINKDDYAQNLDDE